MSNILGLFLLTASYIALGLYISALTTQPIIAAIGTLAVLIGLWLADIGAAAEDSPWHSISPLNHFQNFNNGLLDSSDAAFFVLFYHGLPDPGDEAAAQQSRLRVNHAS